jgi:hypothetical protein
VDTVDAEIDRLISKRASQDRGPDPGELEPGYAESVRRYNARRHEEMRMAWAALHEGQAERTGDKLLARAAYHRAIDLSVQGVVDSYLSSRPQENRAWESYTAAYQEVSQSKGMDGLLERSLTDRAFSEAAG